MFDMSSCGYTKSIMHSTLPISQHIGASFFDCLNVLGWETPLPLCNSVEMKDWVVRPVNPICTIRWNGQTFREIRHKKSDWHKHRQHPMIIFCFVDRLVVMTTGIFIHYISWNLLFACCYRNVHNCPFIFISLL